VALEEASDPLVSDAWLVVALATCYQRGKRDDWIAATIEALHWNIANTEAQDRRLL
jgi:hypothetical protein